MRWRFLVPAISVAVLIALAILAAGISRPASAQGSTPATGDITVSNGVNPGEVVISWDAVPQATHYRIGYVNMVQELSIGQSQLSSGEWIEAFCM